MLSIFLSIEYIFGYFFLGGTNCAPDFYEHFVLHYTLFRKEY